MIYYDFSTFQQSFAPEGHSGRCRNVILFLGNSLEFSNHNLEAIAAELSGIDVVRLEKLAEVREVAKQEKIKTKLLLLPEERFDDLTERFSRYTDAAPDARIVFAYENEPSAAAVYKTSIGHFVSYLPMQCRIDVWTAYIRLLCSGELVIPRALTASEGPRDTERMPVQPEKLSIHLTPRENEVLSLVADGAGNRQIAKSIGISEHTVKLHLHNVFTKLDVSNRAGAVAWYIRNVA